MKNLINAKKVIKTLKKKLVKSNEINFKDHFFNNYIQYS